MPVAISIAQLQRTPRTVAIAGGGAKVRAIVAALRTGALDILITDDTAATGSSREHGREVAAGAAKGRALI